MKTSNCHVPSRGRSIKERLQKSFLGIIFIILCAVAFILGTGWHQKIYPETELFRVENKNYSVEYAKFERHVGQCPDVMSGMTKGAWVTRPLTADEKSNIHAFLITARSHYRIPASMQRADNICGNVGFPGLYVHPVLKIRALCNPLGTTPCCSNYRCVNRTTQECSCSSCYDLRQVIHAEYSTWTPKDLRCQPLNFTSFSACELLSGSKLYFIGDSYLRQMYVMMVMHLTRNYVDSALRSTTPKRQKELYNGPFQLLCYAYLNQSKTVCSGQTSIVHHELVLPSRGTIVTKLVTALRNRQRSVILFGLGIATSYDSNAVWNNLIEPILRIYKRTKQLWPKLVWVVPHAHGLMKIPENEGQSDDKLKEYNLYIKRKLGEWNSTYLDTFPMTEGVMAYDGAHYGIGVNTLKIKIVYNYLKELRQKGLW